LKNKGFNDEGIPKYHPEEYQKITLVELEEEKIEKAIYSCGASAEEIEIIRTKQICYENPNQTVNISIDDVGSKKQKEKRDGKQKEKQSGKKKREYIQNTVIHVQEGKLSYVLNSFGIANALRLLIAFLIYNEKLNCRLQFFVDGQRSLHKTILECFAWYKNIGIILDWYHLENKCKMQLSMALKGKEVRNEILYELTHT
jgi:hypothetical protein